MRWGTALVVLSLAVGCGGSEGASRSEARPDGGFTPGPDVEDTGAGTSCTPTACSSPNPCRLASVACPGGECVDTGNAPEGQACPTGVCHAGQCIAPTCVADQACTPPGDPCSIGATTCPGGVCTKTTDAPDGTTCPSGVCKVGTCVPRGCTSLCRLASITPDGRCVNDGVMPDDAPCGWGGSDIAWCYNGECIPWQETCQDQVPCQPDNPCNIGETYCSGHFEEAVCITKAVKLDGTECGDGKVCSGGSCLPKTCTEFARCDAPNPCSWGFVQCASGGPGTCDAVNRRSDGESCGAGLVCSGGTCVPATTCIAGTGCSPGGCRLGVTTCASPTAAPVCVPIAHSMEGVICGLDHASSQVWVFTENCECVRE